MSGAFAYTKLPGRRWGLLRRASLWEGRDHVLSVSGTRFSEEYRRFYYRDVQALIIQNCPRFGSIGIWVLLMYAVFFLCAAALGARSQPAIWIIALSVCLFAAYRLILCFRFSCRCFIQTAVSQEELPALYRRAAARRAADRLRSRITEAQGPLPENVPETVAAPSAEDRSSPLRPAAEGVTPATATRGAILAFIAFALLLCQASLFLLPPKGVPPWLGVALLVGEGLAAISSILFLRGVRAAGALRPFLYGIFVAAGLQVYFHLLQIQLSPKLREFTSGIAKLEHRADPIVTGIEAALGIGGLILVGFSWRNYRRGDPSNS